MPAEGKRQAKKSSVVRDIAIGVSIAAFVLAGFVVIKLTVLDDEEPSPMATLRVLVNGVSGTLLVDGKTIGPINSMLEIPETIGDHQIKVITSEGAVVCDQPVALTTGEIKVVDCATTPAATPPPVADAGVAVAVDAAVAATTGDAGAAATDPTGADAATAAVTPDATVDPKTDPEVAPKTDSKVNPKTDPKVNPKTDPKVNPKTPRTEPRVNKPPVIKKPPVKEPKKKDPPKGGGLMDL
jgi:hypothetical protein